MISGVRASSIRIEVDLVDDGVDVAALHHVLETILHVVAQIVEAQLVVGAVGDVAVVLALALLVVEAVHDDADRQAEELVDLAHPFGVALGEIIVDGDDVDAAAGERVEIDGEGGDQRLAFAGLHLGDFAVVQHHAADELHVEMPLAERTLCRLAHGGEGRHQDVVQLLALGELLLEIFGPRAQRLVGELFQLRFERVDRLDARAIRADAPLVRGTEQLARDSADHRIIILPPSGCAAELAFCAISSAHRPPTAIMLHVSRDRRNVQAAENAALFGLVQGDNAKEDTCKAITAGNLGDR